MNAPARIVFRASPVSPEFEIEPCPFIRAQRSASIPPRDVLYGRHLYRQFVSGKIAPGGVGKTSLVVTEALSMATGRDLLGFGHTKKRPLSVFLYNLEDPKAEIERRIEAACRHYRISDEELNFRLHYASGRNQPCVITERTRQGDVICKPVVDELVAALRHIQADVLIIDPFVSSHNVGENDNGAQDMVVKEWGRVADRAGVAVELIHHARKMGGGVESEVTADTARGGRALVDGCRDVQVLNRMTKQEGERYGIETTRAFFRVHSDKANLAPPSDKADWFTFANVDLENGYCEDDINPDTGEVEPTGYEHESDQIGVVVSWRPPSERDDYSRADVVALQDALVASERHWRKSVLSPDWIGRLLAEVLGWDAETEKERLKRIVAALLKGGALTEIKLPDRHRKERPAIVSGPRIDEVCASSIGGMQ